MWTRLFHIFPELENDIEHLQYQPKVVGPTQALIKFETTSVFQDTVLGIPSLFVDTLYPKMMFGTLVVLRPELDLLVFRRILYQF